MSSDMRKIPSHKVITRIPQKAIPVASYRSPPSFSPKQTRASNAVMMGDVEIIMQLVVGFNDSEPLLKTSMYMANPTAPDNIKIGNDAMPGNDFL